MSNLPCHFFHVILQLILCGIIPIAFGQSATLGGTNFVMINGIGFCFGDQQLTQGPPVITCLHTGYTGSSRVISANVLWFINSTGGNTVIGTGVMAAQYPRVLRGMDLGATGDQLEFLIVTDSAVTSVACRLIASGDDGFLFETNRTAAETIEVTSSVPAPTITDVTPSRNQVMVSLSRPSGLCTAFTVSAYQYTVYDITGDVMVVSTSSGNTATLTGLVMETQYRLEVQAVVDVISQSMASIINFNTTNGEAATTAPTAPLAAGQIAGFVGGILLLTVPPALIVAIIIIYCRCCRKNTAKANVGGKPSPGEDGVRQGTTRSAGASPEVQPVNNSPIYDQIQQQIPMEPFEPYAFVEMGAVSLLQPKEASDTIFSNSNTGSLPKNPMREQMSIEPSNFEHIVKGSIDHKIAGNGDMYALSTKIKAEQKPDAGTGESYAEIPKEADVTKEE